MGAKDLATRTDLLDGFMEIADLSECGGSESYSLLSTRLREIRKVVARVLGLTCDGCTADERAECEADGIEPAACAWHNPQEE